MVTIKGLFRTVSIVKNPVTLFNLKFRKKSSKVTFPNGDVFHVTWPQFRSLRDVYAAVNDIQVQQINSEAFKITTGSYKLVGSHILMGVVIEMESGIYDYDYRDKVVLDIGGFEGDTAVFFWAKGAKKIVVYEPVLEHHQFICENIRLNKMNAEVHTEGIGDSDGEMIVAYDKLGTGFGLETVGSQNKMSIKIKDVSKVIVESGADIAKIDCEGAEISLVNVSKEILRKLEYVMVEIHTHQIRQQLVEKFKSSGFIVDRDSGESVKMVGVSIIHFKRVPNV